MVFLRVSHDLAIVDIVEDLARRGLAIIYISHRTGDLVRLADRVVVLRDGRVVAGLLRPVNFSAALEAMIGRPIAAARPVASRSWNSTRSGRLKQLIRPVRVSRR